MFLQIDSVPYRTNEINRINNRNIFSKNVYNHKVKTNGWRNWEISKPFDMDSQCSGNINQSRSHYDRFGTNEEKWTTTTAETLNQIFSKRHIFEVNPEKSIYNVHTFIR